MAATSSAPGRHPSTFGELLKYLRCRAQLTQRDLAIATGYSPEHISRLEQNQRLPDLVALAALFVPALDLEDEPESAAQLLELAAAARGESLAGRSITTTRTQQTVHETSRRVASRSNLVAPATALIGREREVEMLRALLGQPDVRLVTLNGAGGAGKTRLATEVASELLGDFADGVWYVELASISDPALVASTIARGLGMKEAGRQPLGERLKAYLQESHLLLVLDNFEQVAAAAPLVADLLGAARRLKVLVTSRAPLHLRGEREVEVLPLALPEPQWSCKPGLLAQSPAVRLFIERVRQARPDFALTPENAASVAEICIRLDGLPLAIELAAARMKLLSAAMLLERLEHRLKLLTGGARDLPARQQTIRATIEWSYNLLAASEQALFARLGVFVGGWTLEAAEAVCQGDAVPDDILDGHQSLMDKNLVRPRHETIHTARFTMLETIREYALERVEASGQREALRQQHAAYYLALVEALTPQLRGARHMAYIERLEQDHDNLRAALAWSQMPEGDVDVGVRLIECLWPFWKLRGYLGEGRTWVAGALQRWRDAPARLLPIAGDLAWRQGDYEQAVVLSEQGLALCRALSNAWGMAISLRTLGWVAIHQSDYPRARELLGESLALFRELDDLIDIAHTLNPLAHVAWQEGDYDRAIMLYEEARGVCRKAGNNEGLLWALTGLGDVALVQGDYSRASTLYEENLALARELGYKTNIGASLNRQGEVARIQGNYAQATALYEESLATFREVGDRWNSATVLSNLGYVAQYQHDLLLATARFNEGLALYHELGSKQGIALCLTGLAGVAGAQAQPQRAARLLGAAESLREATGAAIEPSDRADYDRNVAAASAQLDKATWMAAWAEGRAMPLALVIAHALNHER